MTRTNANLYSRSFRRSGITRTLYVFLLGNFWNIVIARTNIMLSSFVWSTSCITLIYLDMHPPPSELHGMRSLYGRGRESWVWEMSSPALARLNSSHGVGEYSFFRSVAPGWCIFGSSLIWKWLSLLLSLLANVSRSSAIVVVVEDPTFRKCLLCVVVGQG